MKALSLIQPWGTLILDGIKRIETRTWSTSHRGDLLICAGQKFQSNYTDGEAEILKKVFVACSYHPKPKEQTPQGVALCVVNLLHVRNMFKNDEVYACYPNSFGRKAWLITDVRPVKQVPIKGKLSIFDVEDSLIELVCPDCIGQGWFADHGCNGTEEDCAVTCPVQVGCSSCGGTGYVPYSNPNIKVRYEHVSDDLPY